jgi:hypothetical protein
MMASSGTFERWARWIGARGVDALDAGLDVAQVVLGHQVGLVEHDLVGEGDLLDRFLAVAQAQQDVLGVDHGGDRVQIGAGP